jgi:hypothetical protein
MTSEGYRENPYGQLEEKLVAKGMKPDQARELVELLEGSISGTSLELPPEAPLDDVNTPKDEPEMELC